MSITPGHATRTWYLLHANRRISTATRTWYLLQVAAEIAGGADGSELVQDDGCDVAISVGTWWRRFGGRALASPMGR